MSSGNLNYKEKQKILTQLGQLSNFEFLGTGAYGDVVTPAFPCSWDFPRYHKKGKFIGKFFSDIKAATEEVSLFGKVMQIDPLSLFLVLPVHQCKIILSRTTEHFKKLVTNAKKQPKERYDFQIIYPYAGKEFIESNTNSKKVQTFIFPIMFLAYMIGYMNIVHQFNHNDIKADNVLYYNKHLRLIDFGLAKEEGIYPLFYIIFINQIHLINSTEEYGLMRDLGLPYENNVKFKFHFNLSPEILYLKNMLRIYIYELNQFFQKQPTYDFNQYLNSIDKEQFIKRFDNYFQLNFLSFYRWRWDNIDYVGARYFNPFQYLDDRVIINNLSVSRIPNDYKIKCLELMPLLVNTDLLLPYNNEGKLSYKLVLNSGEAIDDKFHNIAKKIYYEKFYPLIFKEYSKKQDPWSYGLLLIEYAIMNRNKFVDDQAFKILMTETITGLLNMNPVERYDAARFHKEILEKYTKYAFGKILIKQYVIYVKDYFFPKKNDRNIRQDDFFKSEVNYVSEFLSEYDKYADLVS